MNLQLCEAENSPIAVDDPNIFLSLFEFRARDGHSPKENFLTEALVYVLQRNPDAMRSWVKLLAGVDVLVETLEIDTRLTHLDEDALSSIYPDVFVSGYDLEGSKFNLIVEHKWDSVYIPAQLKRYARLRKSGERNFLAFVCVNAKDRKEANKFPANEFDGLAFKACQWRDVYRTISNAGSEHGMLGEFLRFMAQEGLGPGRAITLHEMQSFIAARDFKNLLGRYCQRLQNEYEWGFIPERFHYGIKVHDAWGRTAILFSEKGSKAAIGVGLLYDPTDHGVQLLNPEKGIDLAIRVQANPATNPSPTEVLALLDQRAIELRKLGATVHTKNQAGNRNKHTLILIRKSLGDVITNDQAEDEQLEVIHQQIDEWCRILFAEPELLEAMATLQPYK